MQEDNEPLKPWDRYRENSSVSSVSSFYRADGINWQKIGTSFIEQKLVPPLHEPEMSTATSVTLRRNFNVPALDKADRKSCIWI